MEFKNVICETPEQFHQECLKWAGKALVRGRKLIAYGEVVATLASQSDIRLVIGARIRDLRTAQNLTQQQLADLAGVTKANICNIEQGAYSVGLDVLNKIATALNSNIIISSSNNNTTMNNFFNELKSRHNNAYYGESPICQAMLLHEVFDYNLFEEIRFSPLFGNKPEAFTIHKQDIEEGGKFYDFRNYSLMKMGREFSCDVSLS